MKVVRLNSSKLIIRGEDFMSINARGLDLMIESMEDTSVDASELEVHMRRVLAETEGLTILVKNFKRSRGDYDPKLIPGLRAGGREEWWPTLQKLQSAAYGQGAGEYAQRLSALLKAWTELGLVLKLTVEKGRAWHERDVRNKCSWIACENHWVDAAQHELRSCAGCGEVRYCSRACQKSDWKRGGHMDECKRVK